MKHYTCIDEAIKDFYQNNHINPERYLSVEKDAYSNDKEHDPYIGTDIFSSKINEWLQLFPYEDINIFLNLLGHYTYLTRREYLHKISVLSEEIFKTLQDMGISFKDTVFITIPSPQGIKSGGDEIRSYLNTANICRGINNNQIVCSEELISPKIFEDKQAVIFIDDLIGSGKTILASINSILKYFQENSINHSRFRLFFAGIYVTQSASSNITKYFKKKMIQVEPIYMKLPKKLLKGGVVFDSKEYKHVIEVIKKYENLIDSYQLKTSSKHYDMGFDKCKLTISFYYNTPNNTLCNFWEYSDIHTPLFERRSQVRPSVNNLKTRKSNNEINAYLQKAVKNETIRKNNIKLYI